MNHDKAIHRDLAVQILSSVHEVEPTVWESLSAGRPFQSHRWYAYGERVMADCPVRHVLVRQDGRPIARATFFVVRNEPLPLPRWLRWPFQMLLRRWPLVICRSPLSSTGGLILPEAPMRGAALSCIIEVACRLAEEEQAAFVMFDFLEETEQQWPEWPEEFLPVEVPQPGTRMTIVWPNFEAYLTGLSPKARKHYRQYQRAAERMNLRLSFHERVTDMEAALRLIRAVERRHGAAPNPWARRMLEEAWRVESSWLAAWIGKRLVGCELILADGDVHMVTALGLDRSVPNVYFLLGYADIRHAIEHGARLLRWGSGAYEVKRRLGFEVENNNHVRIMGRGRFKALLRWFREQVC